MTKFSMPLEELFEKGADADFVREMIAFMAQRLMEADVEGLCGAAHVEREGVEGVRSCFLPGRCQMARPDTEFPDTEFPDTEFPHFH